MNDLQTALDGLVSSGSWKDAIIYSFIAFIGFSVVSALLRSAFFILLGAVAAFYTFSLQSPDSKIDLSAIAPEEIVSMMVEKSQCAAEKIGNIENVGNVIKNGDVIDIAKKCALIP